MDQVKKRKNAKKQTAAVTHFFIHRSPSAP